MGRYSAFERFSFRSAFRGSFGSLGHGGGDRYRNSCEGRRLADILTFPARIEPKVNSTLLAEIDGVVSVVRVGIGQ